MAIHDIIPGYRSLRWSQAGDGAHEAFSCRASTNTIAVPKPLLNHEAGSLSRTGSKSCRKGVVELGEILSKKVDLERKVTKRLDAAIIGSSSACLSNKRQKQDNY
jgi:hypothetical protein